MLTAPIGSLNNLDVAYRKIDRRKLIREIRPLLISPQARENQNQNPDSRRPCPQQQS
jgi:hypothetical protein